jgi:ABC-type sugar transport system ATPase subunit
MQRPFIEMRNITKKFGGVEALKNVDFEVYQNEILALLGDNGAGKSTLIKILSGAEKKDSGDILIEQKKVELSNTRIARNFGIQTVYQDLALAESISAVKNIFLGKEILRHILFFRILNHSEMNIRSRKLLSSIGLQMGNLNEEVEVLSGGQRQAIAIARALALSVKLLILDEPTAAMGVHESAMILEVIKGLRNNEKISVVIISHNLDHVIKIADRAIILKNGERVGDARISKQNYNKILRMIVSGKA